MPHKDPVNWQPISEMPLIASMDRTERVHAEQLQFVDIYAQQISRWRTERPSADQTRGLDRMEEQNRQLRDVTTDVLTLPRGLRQGTINRIMGMSDLELGLQALLGSQRHGRR